jgi:hypothetical protein
MTSSRTFFFSYSVSKQSVVLMDSAVGANSTATPLPEVTEIAVPGKGWIVKVSTNILGKRFQRLDPR